MPIWLRRFTFETIREYYEKQKEETEKQQNMLKNKGQTDTKGPAINPKQPTYTTKAPRK